MSITYLVELVETAYRDAHAAGLTHTEIVRKIKEDFPAVRVALSGQVNAQQPLEKKAVRSQIANRFSKLKRELFGDDGGDDDGGNCESMTALYHAWVKDHNFIPSDEQLAHFTGKTKPAFGYARRILIDKGYVFERENGIGYRITSRPLVVDRAALKSEAAALAEMERQAEEASKSRLKRMEEIMRLIS